ncbi:hypothetical protein BDV3_004572 [Batrachochytrium dendrobatidis]|uniref:methionyl-tRNA formyltransferase n=1 Tax=Batrachochytrium dendrobatidis (strain JEL423) TaxID=403673 RepID=A0A177WHH6_BATDL|nr:Methionyl-tRNA formyltransferase [Batrachochytrium dendrobatidis]OAJ39185.1 methionyl-tRNA formyltransferase [Batrachochytrium dendrobatidis JEL423]
MPFSAADRLRCLCTLKHVLFYQDSRKLRHTISITNLLTTKSRLFSQSSTFSSRYNILYFGTDNFSVACFKSLLTKRESIIKNIQVVTPPDNLKAKIVTNQEVPLKRFCKQNGIQCVDAPPKSLAGWQLPELPSGEAYDIAVVVSFGYFLPRHIIHEFKIAAINVHPSLLPKYRGSSPIQYTILNGDNETGISVIELSPKRFDAGRILKQTHISIPTNLYFEDLHNMLAIHGGDALIDTIEHLDELQKHALTQDESLVTYAPRLEKSAAVINWNKQKAEQIYSLHRAISSRVGFIF